MKAEMARRDFPMAGAKGAEAARHTAFPGIGDMGLAETNGHRNFRNRETLMPRYGQLFRL